MPAEQPVVPLPVDARPRGRRAGGGARADIVTAAREEFAERGYEGSSVRGVARRSDVDPALVRYYFPGGKPELFAVAFADRDIDPARVVAAALAPGLDGLGARLVEQVLLAWDAPGGADRFRVLFAATASGQHTLLRDFLSREVFSRLGEALTGPDVPMRLGLVAAHVSGVLVTRYVLQIEPIASASAAEIAGRVGPVIDRYLRPDELS